MSQDVLSPYQFPVARQRDIMAQVIRGRLDDWYNGGDRPGYGDGTGDEVAGTDASQGW